MSEEYVPFGCENPGLMRNILGHHCPKPQLLREVLMNAIEACQEAIKRGAEETEIRLMAKKVGGAIKLACIDTGIGMSKDVMSKLKDLTSSTKKMGVDANYGMGIKIAGPDNNKAGLVFISWLDGVAHTCTLMPHGMRIGEGDDDDGVSDTDDRLDPVIKKTGHESGTLVVLMGDDKGENTVETNFAALGKDKNHGLVKFLNKRFFEIPETIKVCGFDADRPGENIRIYGHKHYLDQNSTDKGEVKLDAGATVHWWLMKERTRDKQGAVTSRFDADHYIHRGHVGILIRGANGVTEAYKTFENSKAPPIMRDFGIIDGYDYVVLYIESPMITPSVYRTDASLAGGKELPLEEWGTEFEAKMPEALKRFVAEQAKKYAGVDEDLTDYIDERRQFYKVDCSRRNKSGSLVGHATSGPCSILGGKKGTGDTPSGIQGGNEYDKDKHLVEGGKGRRIRAKATTVLPSRPEVRYIEGSDLENLPEDVKTKGGRWMGDSKVEVNSNFAYIIKARKLAMEKVGTKVSMERLKACTKNCVRRRYVDYLLYVESLHGMAGWNKDHRLAMLSAEALSGVVYNVKDLADDIATSAKTVTKAEK